MTLRDATFLRQVLETLRRSRSLDSATLSLESALSAIEEAPETEAPHTSLSTRGRTFYDRLIEEILEQVKSAVSREQLIDFVMRTLAEGAGGQNALGYILLSSRIDANNNLTDLRVIQSVKLHSGRVANFAARNHEKLLHSTLLKAVLIDREEVEFLPTEVTRGYSYNGEFDDLISDKKRGAWICSIPLESLDQRNANRALVALYPGLGTSEQPILPRGANQEWRVFGFLRLAYELLNHQLESVADQVLMQRREILAELGPGIVNHEINQQLTILSAATDVMNVAVRRVAENTTNADDDVQIVAEGLALTYSAIGRLHRIADAFNNLERRNSNASASLVQVVDEVLTLLHYRLSKLGILVETLGQDSNLVLETDIALVEHVILNVLSNAIDAFAFSPHVEISPEFSQRKAEQSPIAQQFKARIRFRDLGEFISVTISNNGPKIDGFRSDRIFEKGITTKPYGTGHGLGLYVCRLVMNFLGGSIELLSDSDREDEMNVGFCITIPRVPPRADELMADSRTLREGFRSRPLSRR